MEECVNGLDEKCEKKKLTQIIVILMLGLANILSAKYANWSSAENKEKVITSAKKQRIRDKIKVCTILQRVLH